MSLQHCPALSLHHCPTLTLHHCPALSLHHCPAQTLHHVVTASLHALALTRLSCDPIYLLLLRDQLLHRSKELWGPDAEEFRPDRFADGISKASLQTGAFLPFSLGPRVCIGQSFAMAEAKVVLGAILCRFRWKLANDYVHHPEALVTQRAKHGMPIVLTPLQKLKTAQ